jgi:plastocyanin
MDARSLKLTMGSLALFAFTLFAASCGSSSSPTSPTPPGGGGGGGGVAADVTITINGMNGSNSFSPDPSTAKVGQTVAWRNADSITHTASANGGAFNTGNIAPGATSSPITMTAAGSFGYHCQIHPSMVGTLNVTQ